MKKGPLKPLKRPLEGRYMTVGFAPTSSVPISRNKCRATLEMEESTLYPLLRRLEGQGLLTSEWREEEKRKKRFYVLSPGGEAMLAALTDEWRGINASLDRML